MNCEDVGQLMSNLLDKELTEEMAERVNQHLLACPDCIWQLHSLKEAIRLLRASLPPPEARPTWKHDLLERLERQGLEEGWLRPSPGPPSRRQLVIASLIREIEG